MITLQMKQKNSGWIERLKARYTQPPLEVAVGYPREMKRLTLPHYPTTSSGAYRSTKDKKKKEKIALGSGASIIEVALSHNYGTDTIPRRAFMELASKKMQPKYKEMMRKAVKDINAGNVRLQEVLTLAGVMGASEVQKAIINGKWQKNAPATIQRKQSLTPLIDSGDMRKYATSKVRTKKK